MRSDNIISNIAKENRTDLLILALFILLSYGHLGADIFSGEIVAPMDLLLNYPGWKASDMYIPLFNSERSDVLDATLPKWNFARNSILNGEVPLWNFYNTLGSPCITILASSLLSVGFIIFSVFGDGIGFTLALMARLAIAGFGTYKLCRTELAIIPSIFGGITYMMCGFNSSWLMWPHVETSMWIPWLLWAIILLDKERTKGRFIILASITSMIIFAGFPYVAFCGLLLAGFMMIWLMIMNAKEENGLNGLKSGLILSSGLGVGVLLASVQIVPFLEWMKQVDTGWRRGVTIFNFSDINILWNPLKYVHDYGTHVVPRVEWCGYVGVITILFAVICIILIFKSKKFYLTPISPIFWLSISILAFIPIFDIKPLSDFVYQLPIFNSNVNSRLLVVLGISFSVLGAWGFHLLIDSIYLTLGGRLSHHKSIKLILLFMFISIVVIHAVDMSFVSKSQNAVVPSHAFYPNTTTIEYVQDNILPGQSVLATNAYMVSGTLTYYDIPEWFSHNYRTSREKEVLGNLVMDAFKTPTAAMFTFDQINLDTDYMDKLGIRYILSPLSDHGIVSQNRNNQPSPSIPPNTLGQSFYLSRPAKISGISLLMATYGKASADGHIVTVTIYDENNNIISISQVDGSDISDNTWINFEFDKSSNLNPGEYSFEVNSEVHKKSSTPITIWGTREDSLKDGNMIVNGMQTNGDLSFKILEEFNNEKWDVFSVENGIKILENKNCPPGAYVIYEDGSISCSSENITLVQFKPTHRAYIVESNRPGLFVMTSRYWPGWEAYCNGTANGIEAYMGMLPATKIDEGLSVIEFKYRPYSFYFGSAISIITLLVMILIPRRFLNICN